MKRILRIAPFVVLAALVGIQFFHPAKNLSVTPPPHPIEATFSVPVNVSELLHRECYDCHSNATNYPWYTEIQPIGWFLAHHINDGKHDLNFDEFSSYRPMRQYRRLKQISDLVNKGEMPLPSYLWIHRNATPSTAEKQLLEAWTTAMRDSMKVHYPVDSLERKASSQPSR